MKNYHCEGVASKSLPCGLSRVKNSDLRCRWVEAIDDSFYSVYNEKAYKLYVCSLFCNAIVRLCSHVKSKLNVMRLFSIITTGLLLNLPANTYAASAHIDILHNNDIKCSVPENLIYINTPSRPWRKLADTLIRRIWGSSVQESSSDGSPAEASISSRYGGEVVLRFSISTEEEARSLNEATNILFLDVWQINEKWIDIRIAKDVVSIHRGVSTLTFGSLMMQVPSLLGLLPKSLQRAHKPLMGELELLQAIADTYPKNAQDSQSPLFVPDTPTSSHERECLPPENKNVFFQDYQPLSVIQPWMELMRALFPTHVQIINVGKSYEGRDISALKLGTHPTNNDEPIEPRPTILITGGLHAREWISVSTVNYIAYSLITSYGKDQTVTRLLDSFDWVFVPTLNPDGYVYSWEIDRLWRKNRQPTSLRFCRGIDLDRSWGFRWNDGGHHDSDTSHDGNKNNENLHYPSPPTDDNPCSESFAGDKPFAAYETTSFATWVRNLTNSHKGRIVGLLDFHSYSQQVLYPYSYSCNAIPPSLEDLQELGLGLSRAIHRTYGRAYGVAPACAANSFNLRGSRRELSPIGDYNDTQAKSGTGAFSDNSNTDPSLLGAGGSQLDWMYHELGVHHAFQIKLPDTGSYGFLLPKKEIVPTGREMLSAVLEYGKFLLGRDEKQDLKQSGTETEANTDTEAEAGDKDKSEDDAQSRSGSESRITEDGDESTLDDADTLLNENNNKDGTSRGMKDWHDLRKR